MAAEAFAAPAAPSPRSATFSILDFDAHRATDSRTRRERIQAAIDQAAGNARLHIPAGEWVLDRSLKWRSGSQIFGDGKEVSLLRLSSEAGADEALLCPVDDTVVNWSISDLTLDADAPARGIVGIGRHRPGGSCISTNGASHGYIARVHVKNAVVHGVDITSPGEQDAAGKRVLRLNADAHTYLRNASRFIVVEDLSGEGCGDDVLTTHYSEYVWINRIVARSASVRHPTPYASNGVEIDDGSRWIWMSDIFAEDVTRAVAVKSHAPHPAPSRVFIRGIHANRCAQALFIYDPNKAQSEVVVQGIFVRNPRYVHAGAPVAAVYVRGYAAVSLSDIHAEGAEADKQPGPAISISGACQGVSIRDYSVRDWAAGNTANPNLAPVHIAAGCRNTRLINGSLANCGWRGVVDAGSTSLYLDGLAIEGQDHPGSVGILLAIPPAQTGSTVTGLAVSGYRTKTLYGQQASEFGSSFSSGDWMVGGRLYAGAEPAGAHHSLGLPGATVGQEVLRVGGIHTAMQVYEPGEGSTASTAPTILKLAAMQESGRSLSAAGSLNSMGADFAEYRRLCSHLRHPGPPGTLLGMDVDGRLTDRFAEIRGRVFVKSTQPGLVGNDRGEEDRAEWELIAMCGLVPVNLYHLGAQDVGKYLVACDDGSGGIGAMAVERNALNLPLYIQAFGIVESIGPDGRPLVNVKIS